MADGLEQAREAVLHSRRAAPERWDVALDLLEAAVRVSERAAVVAELRAHDWRRNYTIDLDTLDVVVDHILEGADRG